MLERVYIVLQGTPEVRLTGAPTGGLLGRGVRVAGYWDGLAVVARDEPCPCGGVLREEWVELTDDEASATLRILACGSCGRRKVV